MRMGASKVKETRKIKVPKKPLYKHLVILGEQVPNKGCPVSHAGVKSILYISSKSFPTWRSRHPTEAFYNITKKPNNFAIYLGKKIINGCKTDQFLNKDVSECLYKRLTEKKTPYTGSR